jgi:hypothetical protein
MSAIKTLPGIATALMVALFLSGCHAGDLKVCKDDNAKLAKRLALAEKQLIDQQVDIDQAGVFIGSVLSEIEAKEARIAALEQENRDLKATKPTEPSVNSQRLLQGAEEIRQLQRQAALKLKAQQAAADANAPK